MKGNELGLLCICRKAGRLRQGFDAVADSLGAGVELILFTSDVSPKTKERMETKAGRHNIKSLCLPHSSDDIWRATGRRAAVMAITDRGLAKQVALLTEHKEESDI